MSGQTQFMSLTLSSAVSYVKSGKLKLLAVYGRERLPAFPDVPTVAESGYPKVIVEGWTGLIVPKGTPAEVIAKIQTEYAKVLADPEVMKFLAGQGQESVGSAPAAYASFLHEEADKWAKVVRGIGLQLNN
jgi:tripartite-type tricarboxylate transporter receptor subunit TctC